MAEGVPLWTVTVWMLLLAGCAGSRGGVRSISEQHLLFNPAWTGIGVLAVERRAWPVTDAYAVSDEQTRYRETILDWQGRFGGDREPYYYRRFHSVRTGKYRR